MTIPMVEVFHNPHSKIWKSVEEVINSADKVEWFENLNTWESKLGNVKINDHTKEVKIYLCNDHRGWIKWNEFSSQLK